MGLSTTKSAGASSNLTLFPEVAEPWDADRNALLAEVGLRGGGCLGLSSGSNSGARANPLKVNPLALDIRGKVSFGIRCAGIT